MSRPFNKLVVANYLCIVGKLLKLLKSKALQRTECHVNGMLRPDENYINNLQWSIH